MEITMKSEDLVSVLNTVKGTFGSSDFPALNNIYFKVNANGEGLAISSNGHEHTQTKFLARVAVDGEALLDGFLLTKLAPTFASGDIEIKLNGFSADITHPSGEVEVLGQDPADFPSITGITEESSFMIPAEDLRKIFDGVAFARNKDSQANVKLQGIAIITENGKTHFVATDTKRVARYTIDTPGSQDINVIADPKIIKGLSSVGGNIAVRTSQIGITFETNDASYQGPIQASAFPNVGPHFSRPNTASITVPVKVLKDTVERVIILGKADKSDPQAEFQFKDTGDLEIQFRSTRGRIKRENVKTNHSGPDVTLTLNAGYVLEGLNKISKDNVEIVFPQTQSGVPNCAILYPEGERDYGVLNMGVLSS